MTKRRIHSAEFKRDAVQLARTSGNLSNLSGTGLWQVVGFEEAEELQEGR